MTSASLRIPIGVEGVVLVQRGERCLVEVGQRDAVELQAVAQERAGQRVAHIVTKEARFSCSSSIVIRAATERSASTIMPSISDFSWSGWKVRRPRVVAARAIASGPARR
jgi:hypothetical protein